MWNQREIDSLKAINNQICDLKVVGLTPTLIRTIGEGVGQLQKGDKIDNACAYLTIMAMKSLGYIYDGNYDFYEDLDL